MADTVRRRLLAVQREIAACRRCPGMVGTPVHGPAVQTPVFLLGQAPGPHEAGLGRPFAWTAGRTLFRWFEQALGWDEPTTRDRVYFAAVARCFPGKAKGGGDRRPDRNEIEACARHLQREVEVLKPRLVLAVGTLAIGEALGASAAGLTLDRLIGTQHRVRWHGLETDVIPLPHPSGASPWPKIEPGKTLLTKAMGLVRAHEATAGFAPCER